ncbi:murein hydrolase regulator LrgA [Bacillus aerolatus]|uniref:Murein hydrolase regulator LrgA n=1 Tax=Bacillus aerolatus TaxID=2653354 RepID=A0A6I1FUJ2_9BACI|nr:CidA/LrgA family protein [Bacillus aerolatus]KAB7706243.1 murein hydrolase regulator LrgA [Bacillus aerolatus]
MKEGCLFLAQLLFLWLIYQLGLIIADFLHLPIPGNVLGMLILFILLSTKIIKIQWIETGASFLNKHLAFFFVPIAVGLMTYSHLLKESGLALAVVLFGSSMIGMAVTGGLAQFVSAKSLKKEEEGSVGEQRHSL